MREVAGSTTVERALWWADILSRAERERLVTEGALRLTRSLRVLALSQQHPKRAEWKIRAEVDTAPAMTALRETVAECERSCVLLRELVELLKIALADRRC